MLRANVRQAVADGQFHVYAVSTIDQGLEILTGVPAGQRQEDGGYLEDTVHGRVMARLGEIARNLKEKDEGREEKEKEE